MSASTTWDDTLDRFDRDLDASAHDLAPWQPPTPGVLPAALPAVLRARAEQILERQQERIVQLQTALAEIHQQLDQLRPRGTSGRPETAAVYVDTRA